MTKFTIALFILLNFFIVSCDDLKGGDSGANNGNVVSAKVGGVEAISVGDNKFLLEGTADNGGNSGHNYRLRFKLPEGESLKFHFFVSKELTGGADYVFSRNSGKVNLEIFMNGKSHSYELTSFNNIEVIDINIDIHNDHTDIHMLAWNQTGPYSDSEDCSFDGGCLYNSEDFAFDIWLGVGKASGAFWGFSGDSDLILILEGPLAARSDA